VDTLELASELNRIAEQKNVIQDILLQINLGDESTKSGASLRNGGGLVADILKFKSINLRGLMALPPLLEDPEKSRPYFKRLSECSKVWFDGRPNVILSMGTSHDFQVAVEEGSHIVRVGTAIFGERPQK
jgi:uncharacterized pyridoxal phosphate-containing UPF0001 family protein